MCPKDKRYTSVLLLALAIFSFAVGYSFWQESGRPPSWFGQEIFSQGENTYPQNFKTEIAFVSREISDKELINGSAFIIDKQKGWFATAAHCVGQNKNRHIKIFYNGVVYRGLPVKVSSRADVAIIKIDGNFNVDNFAEPYKFSTGAVVGEKVFIRGLHPHPKEFLAGKNITGIFREYYHSEIDREVVLDDLLASVTSVDAKINLLVAPDNMVVSYMSAKSCIEMRTEEDHPSSLGGLSGGPIVNRSNELIGILFASNLCGGQWYSFNLKEHRLGFFLVHMIYAVPVKELQDLMKSIN